MRADSSASGSQPWSASDGRLVGEHSKARGASEQDIRNVITCFAARWISGEGETGPEAGAILWADPDQMGGIPTTKGLQATLRKAKAVMGL